MSTMCPICQQEIVNAAGRQKYHGRCRKALEENKEHGTTKEQCTEIAREYIIAQDKDKKRHICDQEKCMAFKRTGKHSGTCLFPRCIKMCNGFVEYTRKEN